MPRVALDRVTVDFPIFGAGSRSIRSGVVALATGGRVRASGTRTYVKALDAVELEFRTGARVALVGHNGSGKSTLLRTMAGIYRPTAGRVEVEGRVSALLDIATGLDFDATGTENAELRGLCLGLSRAEVRSRMAEVAEISELGQFLDLPIRTYSAGMLTRLGFAVSTLVRPDVLLVDESIGAGDAAFLKRTAVRLKEFIARAGVLVFASHADDLVRDFCDEAVMMSHGRVAAKGPVDEVLATYHASIARG